MDERSRSILAELIAEETLPNKEPYQLTLKEVAERTQVTHARTRYRLQSAVDRGYVHTCLVQGGQGQAPRVYWTDDQDPQTILSLVLDAEFPMREPHEQTAREVAEIVGVSVTAAEARLDKLVKKGKATTRKVQNENGRIIRVWSVV